MVRIRRVGRPDRGARDRKTLSRHLVLVFSTIFKFRGGIPRFNQMLCMATDELAPELGFRGTVISQDDSWEDYRASGHDWKHLEFVPGRGQLRLTLETVRRCLSRRPDLLLIGLPGMTPVGVLCRPLVRGGFGFVAHGIDVWEETRRSRRVAAGRARFALAVSTHTAASIEQHFGLPARAIRLLPNTLDPAFERVDEPADRAAAEPPELLTVSRLWSIETMKGVDHTLQAFARLAATHPTALYRIVGKGDDQPRLRALAGSLGIEERVVFEQDLTDEELAERYRRCAAFVLPSGAGGFRYRVSGGDAILEAVHRG